MKSFTDYLIENTSIDDELLGHLTHIKDIPHEAPDHIQTAIDLIRGFHDHRQGKPSEVQASIKHDGGASVHIIHDKNGKVGVSDKHRFARGVVAYSDEEIDHHFGKHESYAQALKHLRSHGQQLVSKGHHVQGDILYTPADGTHEKNSDHVLYTPNRLTYQAQTTAPVGIAIHTQITNGVAHAPSDQAVRSVPAVFVPKVKFDPSEHRYSPDAKAAVQRHLKKAEALAMFHTTDHLTPEHIEQFTIYNNRVSRGSRAPTVSGYKEYLRSRGYDEANKLKTLEGRNRVVQKYSNMMNHVDEHAEHFQRSLTIRHHLQAATDTVLHGIKHPDKKTLLDKKTSRGEGVVLQKKDQNGMLRPVAKLVHSDIQHALGNNPRFPNKGAIYESAEKSSPVHAFYGKVQYATIGHKSAIDQMRTHAKKDKAKTVVGLSNTPGPLGIKGKKAHAESIFNHPVETGEDHTTHFISFVKNLHDRGHTHLHIHAGSDRADHYKKLIHQYNGKPTKSGEVLFHFKSVKVHKVGADRDESDNVKDPRQMNHEELHKTAKASRLRAYAADGSEESRQKFHAYHKPLGMDSKTIDGHWNNLKRAMKKTVAESFLDYMRKTA